MKILVALDSKEYSKNILKDVARLARNTLADILFLGVQDGKVQSPEKALVDTLLKYQENIYSFFSSEELPYAPFASSEFTSERKGLWSISSKGMKEFTIKIATDSIAKQAVAIAKESECNLIILGCSSRHGCEWSGEMNAPLRIAKDAPCSVLVVKKAGNPDQIISIMDKSFISQDSLEMVNQVLTLHDAGLKIVGLKEKKGSTLGDDMEKRMVHLLKYYNDLEINAWLKLIDAGDIEDYVIQSSREAIVALWMGKQSLIKKLFSHSMVDKLLETTRSSLLILR